MAVNDSSASSGNSHNREIVRQEIPSDILTSDWPTVRSWLDRLSSDDLYSYGITQHLGNNPYRDVVSLYPDEPQAVTEVLGVLCRWAGIRSAQNIGNEWLLRHTDSENKILFPRTDGEGPDWGIEFGESSLDVLTELYTDRLWLYRNSYLSTLTSRTWDVNQPLKAQVALGGVYPRPSSTFCNGVERPYTLSSLKIRFRSTTSNYRPDGQSGKILRLQSNYHLRKYAYPFITNLGRPNGVGQPSYVINNETCDTDDEFNSQDCISGTFNPGQAAPVTYSQMLQQSGAFIVNTVNGLKIPFTKFEDPNCNWIGWRSGVSIATRVGCFHVNMGSIQQEEGFYDGWVRCREDWSNNNHPCDSCWWTDSNWTGQSIPFSYPDNSLMGGQAHTYTHTSDPCTVPINWNPNYMLDAFFYTGGDVQATRLGQTFFSADGGGGM